MNLLIVDDLPGVVEGLAKGIRWNDLGFTGIFKAYNAVEARSILQSKDITVMLCDIQMPVESGLELYRWMRSCGIDVCTIFLTSYAEFEYARQAIRLGAEDYIVQPAPYSEIYNAVAKAVEKVREAGRRSLMADLGQTLHSQTNFVQSGAIHALLGERLPPVNYQALEKLALLPPADREVWPCLLHLGKWDTEPVWEAGLMDSALNNMLLEIFEPFQITPALGAITVEEYLLLIPAGDLTAEVVAQQLRFLLSACEQYLDCPLSVYFTDPALPTALAQPWDRLRRKHAQNITRKSAVFYVEDNPPVMRVYRVSQIRQWAALVKGGYGRTLDETACAMLDTMVSQQKMNAKTLQTFYLDFMEMVFSSADCVDTAIFDTPEKMDIYRCGMKDIPSMKRLIHLVAQSCGDAGDDQDQKTRVERIKRYIHEHLDRELKRDELAEKVNLSPDYMAKIFKAETGETLKEYIIRQKMDMARSLLRTTNLPVSFVAAKVGYPNLSHFSYTYKKEFGITPQEERRAEPVS